MAASRVRTALRLLLQAQARTKMINTAQRSKLVPRISGPGALVYAVRLAPASRNYVILRSLSRKVVAKHRRYYSVVEVTVQNKYTRTRHCTRGTGAQKRIAGGCSGGPYEVLLAAASKRAVRARYAPSLRCWRRRCEGAALRRARRVAGCWRGALGAPGRRPRRAEHAAGEAPADGRAHPAAVARSAGEKPVARAPTPSLGSAARDPACHTQVPRER